MGGHPRNLVDQGLRGIIRFNDGEKCIPQAGMPRVVRYEIGARLGHGLDNAKVISADGREARPLPQYLEERPYFGSSRVFHPQRRSATGQTDELLIMVNDSDGIAKRGKGGEMGEKAGPVNINFIIDRGAIRGGEVPCESAIVGRMGRQLGKAMGEYAIGFNKPSNMLRKPVEVGGDLLFENRPTTIRG